MTLIKDFKYLPKKYHKSHQYCFSIISEIEDLILNRKFKDLKNTTIEFPPNMEKEFSNVEINILDLLEKYQSRDIIFHLVKNSLLNSLIIETCYFLQESMECSLKKRMTVCFTLLRKPFLEILVILMRILNEENFIDNFNYKDGFDPIRTTPYQKRKLIFETNNQLFDKYQTEDLYDYIFDKNFGDSIFNVTNNSIHLFTDRNPTSATEKQNLNFIFSQEEDIQAQWEYLYHNIPMLISFLADLLGLLTFKSTSVKEEVFIARMKKRDSLKVRYNVS